MRICLSHTHGQLEIRPSWDGACAGQAAGAAETTILLRDAGQAHRLLGQYCTNAYVMMQLRQLLAGEVLQLHRRSDRDILGDIAGRLANGRLLAILVAPSLPTQRSAPLGDASAPLTGAAPVPAPRARPLRPPPEPEPVVFARHAIAAPPDAIVEPAPEFDDGVDQDAQAATLELAAQHGTPFCAICERARLKALERAAA